MRANGLKLVVDTCCFASLVVLALLLTATPQFSFKEPPSTSVMGIGRAEPTPSSEVIICPRPGQSEHHLLLAAAD